MRTRAFPYRGPNDGPGDDDSRAVSALRRFWPLSLGVFVVIFGLGALAALIPADRYRSTEPLLLEPRASDAAVQLGAQVDVLAPPVIEQVGSDEFLAKVEAEPPETVGNVILSAENEPGTGIVFIHAESTDPDVAQPAAEAAAARFGGTRRPTHQHLRAHTGDRAGVGLGQPAGRSAFRELRPRPDRRGVRRCRRPVAASPTVERRLHPRPLRHPGDRRGSPAAPAPAPPCSCRTARPRRSSSRRSRSSPSTSRSSPAPNSVLATTSWAQGEGKTVVTRSSAGRSRRCSTR